MPANYTDRIATYFREHPGRWTDGKELAEIGGAYAWRSRVSDCRTKLGMVIENRERKVSFGNGDVFTASEYRYLPVYERVERPLAEAEQVSLFT